MSIKNHILLFLIIGSALLFGCSGNNNQEFPSSIKVDCGDTKEIILTEENSEVFNLGVLDNIIDVLFYKGLLLTRSRNQVSAFDVNSGELVYRCSNRGRREDEFTSIIDAWIRDRTLYIYDFNSSKILCYDVTSGNYTGNTLVETPDKFSLMRWDTENERYVGVRTFTQSPVPDLAVYDSSFNFKHYLDTPIKKSGIMVSPPLKVSESDGILYHRPFERTVFRIKDAALYETYLIDFGANQIPESLIEEQDLYDVILHWTDNQDKFAAFSMDFSESDASFFFTYRFSDHVFLASYNKKNKKTEVYHFDKGGDSPSAKIYYHSNYIFVFTQIEDNTLMYKIPVERLG